MRINNELGYIEIAPDVMAGIAGYAASSCFGVKGMTVRSVADGVAHLLRRENMSRGVKISEAPDGGINIDLHIAVVTESISPLYAVQSSARFAITSNS